jgi:hypothetical protein
VRKREEKEKKNYRLLLKKTRKKTRNALLLLAEAGIFKQVGEAVSDKVFKGYRYY